MGILCNCLVGALSYMHYVMVDRGGGYRFVIIDIAIVITVLLSSDS